MPPPLRVALGIRTAPDDPPLLLEPETIPKLRSEAAEAVVEDAIAACSAAIGDGASQILYLTADDGYGSAPDLAKALSGLDAEIVAEPSGAAMMGAGWQAIAAAEAIRDGHGLPEALAAARRVREQAQVLAMLEHPELASAAGNAELGIVRHRALVYLRGAEVNIVSRPTKREDALAALRDQFASAVGDASKLHVAVHHAAAGPGADALALWIERELAPARVLVAPITRHAATRLGPRMLGLAWYEE